MKTVKKLNRLKLTIDKLVSIKGGTLVSIKGGTTPFEAQRSTPVKPCVCGPGPDGCELFSF